MFRCIQSAKLKRQLGSIPLYKILSVGVAKRVLFVVLLLPRGSFRSSTSTTLQEIDCQIDNSKGTTLKKKQLKNKQF